MIVKNALKEFKNELKKEMVAEQTELIKDIAAVMNSDSSDNEDDLQNIFYYSLYCNLYIIVTKIHTGITFTK